MITVLYVDDESDLCELGKLFLEQAGGFTVETETSAADALASPRFSRYDAIVSDYQMPEIDGIEFLRRVRKRAENVPFILFTGRGREEIVIAAINEGADFYLQKGGDPTSQYAELAHKIRIAVERRQARSDLKDSEQRLNDIINFLPDATFAIDRSGSVISWNRAIEEMTGVPAADMLGQGNLEYAIPFYGIRRKILIDLIFESDEEIAKNYAHILHEKNTLIAETSLPRPKGQPRILMGKASPLYNRQGEIVGAIESIRDITSLRKAEEDVSHTRKDWEAIFRSIGHPAIVLDAENHIIDANDATIRATGMSLPALKGKRCYEIFHAPVATGPPGNCPFEQIRHGTVATATESVIESLGGYYDVSCTPVFAPDGKLEKVIHIAMDVTDRHRAQEELRAAYEQMSASQEELKAQYDALAQSGQRIRESEEKYRELAELLPQIIFELDLQFLVTYGNRHALAAFGITQEDIAKGMNGLSLIAAEDHGRIRMNLEKVFRGESYEDHEYMAVRPDGTKFPVLIYSSPILRNGKPVGLRGVMMDISARRKTEDALRESEATLDGIFRLAPVGIGVVRDRILLRVNEKFCEMSGYAPEELIGRNSRFLYPTQEDYEHVGNERYRHDEKYGLNAVGTRWVRKDGTVRNILISGTPLDKDKPEESWIIVVLDITETKQAEDELQLLKISVDRAFDEVFWMDFTGRILYVNDSACRITGYTREELLGMKIFELDPDFPPNVWEMSVADLRQRKTQFIITRHRCKNGRIIDVEIVAVYVRKDGSEYSFAFVRDITDRMKMEAQIEEQHRQLDTFMQNLPLGIFRTTPGVTGRIIMANPVIAQIHGYDSVDELMRVPVSSLYADARVRKSLSQRLEREGAVTGFEVQLKKKTGDLFWATISAVAVPGRDGKIAYFDGVIRDISEQKLAQTALAEANRKLGLLNSITRHDIRNQLTALIGFVEVASRKRTDPAITEYLDKIQAIATTISNQIEFTRMYQELGMNAPAWLPLADVITGISVRIPVTIADSCRKIEVFADPLLERVFLNLFENSVMHGGNVTAITIGCERQPDGLTVYVEDNGPGIAAHEKEKIFSQGYGKHTGLGLFLAREILSITGITIQENGTPGKGARFELFVPKDAYRVVTPPGK